jgi:hypothetical protein
MGRQFVQTGGATPDMYFPLFTFLQFFFYMGWLKVKQFKFVFSIFKAFTVGGRSLGQSVW